MEQHPVPRQITTFEFKLVGFMTLKQFIYLIIFLPIAYIVIRIFPIPILNILLGVLVGGFGLALAFVPVNDRPLDVFLINLYKRLTSPTQYTYQKSNTPPSFLTEPTSHQEMQRKAHLDTKQKLESYLHKSGAKEAQKMDEEILKKRQETIKSALSQEQSNNIGGEGKKPQAEVQKKTQTKEVSPIEDTHPKPFVSGVVKNSKQMPIPGLLLYIKDQRQTPLRLLKTNPHGVFATYRKLPPGEYEVEIKDPKDTFFFDKMKIQLDENNPRPLEFYSREII